MADYYPLIARAISGLDPSAPGEQRRALYERARSALIAQLRSVQPPLSESEITRERLSLEEAVRKVESEAAQRAREATRPSAGNGNGGRSKAGDAFRNNTRTNPRPPESDSQDEAPSRNRPAPPPSTRNLRADAPAPPTRDRPGAPRRAPHEGDRPQGQGSSGNPGMRGFRDVTADAEDLGRSAAQANRAARKTYANVPSPSPEFDRMEPSLENRSGDFSAPYSYDESPDEAARYQTPAQPAQRPRPAQPNAKTKPRRERSGGGFPLKSAIVIGLVLVLAGAAILWGPKTLQIVRGLLKSNPLQTVEAPKDAVPPPRQKFPDRVGQPGGETLAPVAQRVVLYDEDPNDPKGKQSIGTVVWRTEQLKGSGNTPGEIAVRADVEIPDRKFKMTMSFRRNTDTSLPASHTAELTFILPPNFDGGGVSNVPGILMKSNEQARGTPLAGLAVKVTDGFFLIGLSNVEVDRSRNLQLLKERSWFDVPLVYTNQRRGIIAIEKGEPGERAFTDAFAAWGE